LVVIERDLGHLEQAKKYYQLALVIFEAALPANHPAN
jgi:hypothetical protein